ncbi:MULTISPECIES: LuxR C-terminal-related transcriptional regulator [Aquitalea]|uniref:response regulator transcription factor n=1 Tax=Aquitalea TaxID=407217 RepID=UPI001359F7D8|nr:MULTISPECIES: LuxR C-terminal-related transcriptional regulator [Aquitalea]
MTDAKLLTPREKAVIALMAESRSNKQIARTLEIGVSTVKSYVSSILLKLALKSRLQVGLYALRHGLVTVDAAFYQRVLGCDPLPEDGVRLTARQRDIIRLAAAGLCLKEMAIQLQISLYTVKVHLHHVLLRLQVGDRYSAIIMAMRLGWLELPAMAD